MSATIFTGWHLLTYGTATNIIFVGAAVLVLRSKVRESRDYMAAGDAAYAQAEQRDAAFEETRNKPWYWPTGPAIEAAPAEHDAEVLHVAYPTQELRTVKMPAGQFDDLVASLDVADYAPRLAALADEVGLVQAVGCCTGHGDEPCSRDSGLVPPFCCPDCPDQMPALTAEPHITADDLAPVGPKDGWRAPWWSPLAIAAAVLAVALLLPVWLAWMAGEWLVGKTRSVAAAWRRRRDERYLIGSGEQATSADPFAELLKHVEANRRVERTSEAEELELLDKQWKSAVAAVREKAAEPEPVRIVRNTTYRKPGETGLYPHVKVVGDKAAGRHRLRPEPEMPAVNASIPTQRDGGDDL